MTTVTGTTAGNPAANAAANLTKYRTAHLRPGQALLARHTGTWHIIYTGTVAYAYSVQCVRGRQTSCLVTCFTNPINHARNRRRAQ